MGAKCLLPEGLAVMQAWGFSYKTNLVWHKIRNDGGSDGRGGGFYFRNVSELVLFGVRAKQARTLDPGRRQVNYLESKKREHSESLMNFIPLSRPAPPGRMRSCSRAGRVWGGNAGVRSSRTMPQLGSRE